jgi:hypothetical protein
MTWLQLAAAISIIGIAVSEPSQTTPASIGLGCSGIVNVTSQFLGKSRSLPLILLSLACVLLGILVAILTASSGGRGEGSSACAASDAAPTDSAWVAMSSADPPRTLAPTHPAIR